MQAQLVAIEGPLRGSAWAIGDTGLILGRDASCNVRLYDVLASRKHCRLFWQGKRLELEDLGARNPVLIAGEARREGIVRIGETLAIGGDLFLVVGGTTGLAASSTSKMDDTLSLGQYLSLQLPDNQTIRLENRLSTVEQLAFAFETVSLMGLCETEDAVSALLYERIEKRLAPARFWMVRSCHGQHISCYAAGGSAQLGSGQAPPESVREALREGRSLFLPGDETEGALLVAPMKVASHPMGALVVQAGARDCRESDLPMLQLLATLCAHFLYSLKVQAQLLRDNERLRMRAGESVEFLGDSPAACAVREQVLNAARSDLNVLVLGETGTGKELAARMLHAQSDRSSGPFVHVNCAAIPEELFESQLFGHVRGAFTGAQFDFKGFMEQADGGTLFLDEIADLSLNNQARILGAIEYGLIRRLGEPEERRVDIRVLAATNKDLHAGTFRTDLYHRLNGFEITIPPLRERKEDISLLANLFFQLGRTQARRPLEGFSQEAMDYLLSYAWPGNVRELRNCILRAVSTAQGDVIQPADVAVYTHGETPNGPGKAALTLDEAEKRHIERVLRECMGKVSAAASILGVSRSTLYKKMTDLGIHS